MAGTSRYGHTQEIPRSGLGGVRLFWAFLATKTAINPVLEPLNGPPVISILQIALVVLCGLVIVRVIWSRNAFRGVKGEKRRADVIGNAVHVMKDRNGGD